MTDPTNAPPAADPAPKAPQTNVRLAQVARDNLARLQAFYGTSVTATLSFALAEAVRRLPPPTPFTMPSTEVSAEDEADLSAKLDAQRFARDYPR